MALNNFEYFLLAITAQGNGADSLERIFPPIFPSNGFKLLNFFLTYSHTRQQIFCSKRTNDKFWSILQFHHFLSQQRNKKTKNCKLTIFIFFCIAQFSLGKYKKDPTSETRLGEFTPLWHYFKNIWAFLEGLFSIWQNLSPTLANC